VSFTDDPERVEVTVRRGGEKSRKVTLERKAFRAETVLGVRRREDNSWDYFADRKNRIAHIRISSVGNGTALSCGTC
jgi:C-terminal processing protease CtpA/Prc